MGMLLGSIIPLVYAEDAADSMNAITIDDKTRKQAEIMNNGIGAEIRLLQLEKAILRNIEKGEAILSYLNDSDVDLLELEAIIAELELLKQEVHSADFNATDAVRVFVDLKHDAVNLTKDFRETVRVFLNGSIIEQLQQRLRNMTGNQTKNLSNRIQAKIRQFNSNQFHEMFQLMEKNGSIVMNQYQNGSLTLSQLKQQFRYMFNQTEKAKQFNVLSSVKQEKIQHNMRIQNRIQNASMGFQQRKTTRLMNRLHSIENPEDNLIYQQLMNRLQNKLNKIGNSDNPGNQDGSGQGPPGNGGSNKNNGPGGSQ